MQSKGLRGLREQAKTKWIRLEHGFVDSFFGLTTQMIFTQWNVRNLSRSMQLRIFQNGHKIKMNYGEEHFTT